MERKVFLHSHPTYRALGNALQISGYLLKPGVYVGLDGVPTKYTEDFIRKVKKNFVGRPIGFAHSISPESMVEEIPKGTTVGFWTGISGDGFLRARGYVFDPRAISYIQRNPSVGISMEADISTELDPVSGVEEATGGMLTGGVLIDDPACKACRVESVREVNLQSEEKEEWVEDTLGDIIGATEDFIKFETDVNLAKPTRTAFFDWLEKQMKDAGVPDNIIPKAIGVLKRAIKVPYPYPYPKAQEALEAEFGKELAELVTEMLMSYREYTATCMKAGHTMEECAGWWKTASKYPRPTYPPPGGKAGESLEEQLAATRLELEALKTERTAEKAAALAEEVNKLSGEIKTYDTSFDATKFLEGVECKVSQTKMLQRVLEALKKTVRPIRLQIAEDTAKTLVEEQVKAMFGKGSTFESIFELPEKKKGE